MRKYWRGMKEINCTPAVANSGLRSGIRKEKKQRQQRECDFWANELEYMERNKSFHKERLKLKKQFNARCK